VVREMLPREWFGPAELLRWLEDVHSSAMSGPDALMRKGAQTCAGPSQGDLIKVVVVILNRSQGEIRMISLIS
jgi:hypothetical protein